MPTVFISYVHENQELVKQIVSALEKCDIEFWLDIRELPGGVYWKDKIRNAIKDGGFFLACFSAESSEKTKSHMNEEITVAIDEMRKLPYGKTFFIPVVLTETTVPDIWIGGGRTLNDLQRIEMYQDWDAGIEKIIESVGGSPDKLKEHKDLTLIEAEYIDYLYYMEPNFASSIRLIGASDEFFPQQTLHVSVDDSPYELPLEFAQEKERIVAQLEENAKKDGRMLYDGPHTRLVDFRATPTDQTEQKHLELTFGPVGWYDYTVANYEFGRKFRKQNPVELRKYVDLDRVAKEGDIRSVRFSNIVGTATTIITSDGYALYTERSQRVSVNPAILTCCVAENIHQEKDGSLELPKDGELPAPFKAVIRGIDEELSPRLNAFINPDSILLLGIAFDLRVFHPDFLFVVFTTKTYQEIKNLCRQYPGPDYIEGQIQPVSAEVGSDDLNDLLSRPDWTPDGKASLIRAIEFLDAVRYNSGLSMIEVIDTLAKTGKLPY